MDDNNNSNNNKISDINEDLADDSIKHLALGPMRGPWNQIFIRTYIFIPSMTKSQCGTILKTHGNTSIMSV